MITNTSNTPGLRLNIIKNDSKAVNVIIAPETEDKSNEFYDNMRNENQLYTGYGEGAHVVIHSERSILSDLKNYPFSDDIKNRADCIYNTMRHRVHRGKVRNQMLFYVVYCAHLELDRDVNPIHLGTLFGLTQGETQRCDSIFSYLQTGYRMPRIRATPVGYLPNYCESLALSQEATEEIAKLATSILRKDPSLYQENPQTVAAGILRYYTVTNGIINDDPFKLPQITGRSNVTIETMYRRIATVDNS